MKIYFRFWLRSYICRGISVCTDMPNFIWIGPSFARHLCFKCGGCWRRQSTSGFQFNDVALIRRCVSLNMSKLVQISQSTAEIYLFPVLQYEQSLYWNSTSGFEFDPTVNPGISVCISIPNFIWIRLSVA